MKSTADVQSVVPPEVPVRDYQREYMSEFQEYLDKQPGIVKFLHTVLKGFARFNYLLAGYFFIVGLYWTFIWITTGALSQLGVAWANYGLSMSFLVFPWGLDIMLLRAWPTELQQISFAKPVHFRTGPWQILAGFGIMAAGAPGAARMIGLAAELLAKIF